MNAMLSTIPLPEVLERAPACSVHRRHRIDAFQLTDSAVCAFNRTLEKLGRADALDCDRIATAARELLHCGCDVAPCIRQRMRRAQAATQMLHDPGWRVGEQVRDALHRVFEYVRRSDDLIPDRTPHVGRLDDALVIDVAWPLLADEFTDYLDFRRLRQLCGSRRDPGFDRDSWRQAREDEAALVQYLGRVRSSCYVPAGAPMFLVH